MFTVLSRRPLVPAALCWAVLLLEGYDLVAFSALIPTLTARRELGFDTAGATMVATLTLVGVALGAGFVAPMADRVGRRAVILWSVLGFSGLTLALPWAGSVGAFAALRLTAGIALGAALPITITLMSEVVPDRHRTRSGTWTMTGYHVGAVLASLVALWLLPRWKEVMLFGGAAGLVLLPLLYAALPASTRGSRPRAAAAELLRPPQRRTTLALWAASFMGLLLVYGLNSWLPKMMSQAGYPIARSVTLLLVLNVGAVLGLLVAGWVGDRHGVRMATIAWFGAAAVLLATLTIRWTNGLVLNSVVLVTGFFVFSAQVLLYAYVTHVHAREVRGTALGLVASVGRVGAIVGPLVTGWLVARGDAVPWGFWFFAAVAVLAVGGMSLTRREV